MHRCVAYLRHHRDRVPQEDQGRNCDHSGSCKSSSRYVALLCANSPSVCVSVCMCARARAHLPRHHHLSRLLCFKANQTRRLYSCSPPPSFSLSPSLFLFVLLLYLLPLFVALPTLVFFPVLSLCLTMVVAAWWSLVQAFLVSAGRLTVGDLTVDVNTSGLPSSISGATAKIAQYESEDAGKYLMLIHLFGTFWTLSLIEGIGLTVIATR